MTPDGTQAIRRAIEILTRIAHGSPEKPVAVSALAKSLGLPRSTIHRILKSLIETGLVIHSTETRSYEIGLLAFELGLAVSESTLDIAGLTALTRRVCTRTGVNSHLMRRSGIEAVCLASYDGDAAIRVTPVIAGQRRFLGIGAGACALLAELGDAAAEKIIATIVPHLESYPNFSAEYIRDSIQAARACGYAESDRRIFSSMYGLGMTVPSDSGVRGFAVSIAAYAPDATPALKAKWIEIMREEIAAYVSQRAH